MSDVIAMPCPVARLLPDLKRLAAVYMLDPSAPGALDEIAWANEAFPRLNDALRDASPRSDLGVAVKVWHGLSLAEQTADADDAAHLGMLIADLRDTLRSLAPYAIHRAGADLSALG